jgi:hypothetical protein
MSYNQSISYMKLYRSLPCLLAMVMVIALSSCRPGPTREDLYQTWLHSFEEDKADIMMFRPNVYPFPPARGREGFTIASDGGFVWHAIAPADGTTNRRGTWKRAGDSGLAITLTDNGQQFTLQIHAHDAQRLQLFKNSFPKE